MKRTRNVSYSLTSVQDLSGSQLNLGATKPNLAKTRSFDPDDGSGARNPLAAVLAKKSTSAIADSINLGKSASKELSNPDRNNRKKSDSRRRRSLDSETAKIAAVAAGAAGGSGMNTGGGSSWLKFQQRNAKESVSLPAIAGADNGKEKEKEKARKSRRSYDPEASLPSTDKKPKPLRRGSLGSLPNMGL